MATLLHHSNAIPFPAWAEDRPGWTYVGWIDNPPDRHAGTFEEVIARQRQSDHGEERAVDVYPQGAVCWCRERTTAAPQGQQEETMQRYRPTVLSGTVYMQRHPDGLWIQYEEVADLLEACKTFLRVWKRAGPLGSHQFEKFDVVVSDCQKAIAKANRKTQLLL